MSFEKIVNVLYECYEILASREFQILLVQALVIYFVAIVLAVALGLA